MPGRGTDRLVKSLRDHGSTVNELGGGEWKAQCPAHDDRTPSLSVTDTENRALFFCHAGCDGKDVLKALGLTNRDLFHKRITSYDYGDGLTSTRAYTKDGEREFRVKGDTKDRQ